MADPTPTPTIDLSEIEKVLDDLLQNDPAKVQRLHDFLSKIQAVLPVIKVVLSIVSLLK